MQIKEMKMLLTVIRNEFPTFVSNAITLEEFNLKAKTWLHNLQEKNNFTDAEITWAVDEWIDNEKEPPHLANIKSIIKAKRKSERMQSINTTYPEAERAWENALHAIRNSSDQTFDWFAWMDDISQKIIGSRSELKRLGQESAEITDRYYRRDFIKKYNDFKSLMSNTVTNHLPMPESSQIMAPCQHNASEYITLEQMQKMLKEHMEAKHES